MVYIRWHLVNPHVQTVQNMYGTAGRGSLRPIYRRPKLTLVSRFVAMQLRCQGSKSLCQYWSDRFETNSTWAPLLGPQVLFVSKRSDQNWRSNFDPWHLCFFNTTVFWPMTSFWTAVTSKQRFGHQNRLHILNPECVRIPRVVAPKNFPLENFRVRSVLPKKTPFHKFSCTHIKKCSWLLCA